MSNFTRVGSYLGLALFVVAIALLAILPGPSNATSSEGRDKIAAVGIVGYVLILYRLGYLAFRGEGRWTRALSVVGILALLAALAGVNLFLKSLEQPV